MAPIDLVAQFCRWSGSPFDAAAMNSVDLAALKAAGVVRLVGLSEFAPCPHCDPPEMAIVKSSADGVFLECATHAKTKVDPSDIALYELNASALARALRSALEASGERSRHLGGPVWAIGRASLAPDLLAAFYLVVGDGGPSLVRAALSIMRAQARADLNFAFHGAEGGGSLPLTRADELLLPLSAHFELTRDGKVGCEVQALHCAARGGDLVEDLIPWSERLKPVVAGLWDRSRRKPKRAEIEAELRGENQEAGLPSRTTIASAIQREKSRREKS